MLLNGVHLRCSQVFGSHLIRELLSLPFWVQLVCRYVFVASGLCDVCACSQVSCVYMCNIHCGMHMVCVCACVHVFVLFPFGVLCGVLTALPYHGVWKEIWL